jgi:hypothetical protein
MGRQEMGRLLSVNAGLPREISWRGETVRTSAGKNPVQDRRLVRRLNVDGDGQGDLAGHGGEHRAVLVCQIPTSTGNVNGPVKNIKFGQFGANFMLEGLADDEQHRMISNAMSKLTPGLRRALELREFDERSIKETARMMGISIELVKSRVFRGRR